MKQIVKILMIVGIFGFGNCCGLPKELSEKKFTEIFYEKLITTFPEVDFEITGDLVISYQNKKHPFFW